MNIVQIKLKHYDRWDRYREAMKILTSLKVNYSLHNLGAHIIIHNGEEEIHYWASTGKWFIPETKEKWTHETRFLGGILNRLGYNFIEID